MDNNRRRIVITLGAGAWSLIANAQHASKIYRIGYLSNGQGIEPREEAFRERLGELGYADGKNAVIEWRFNRGKLERAPEFAAELVSLNIDCIVTLGVTPTRAAMRASSRIPIVIGAIDADPVKLGFIDSLARPGGNVTGFTGIAYELAGKRLELIKEAVPKAVRAAILVNAASPGAAQAHIQGTAAAAGKLGMQLKVLRLRGPEELARALDTVPDVRAEVLSVIAIGWINNHRERIVKIAADARVPAIYSSTAFTRFGGLLTYAADGVQQNREAAGYVAKILAGIKPANLPVQRPTKFELAINLKAAKALGLDIPPEVMVRATRIIQ